MTRKEKQIIIFIPRVQELAGENGAVIQQHLEEFDTIRWDHSYENAFTMLIGKNYVRTIDDSGGTPELQLTEMGMLKAEERAAPFGEKAQSNSLIAGLTGAIVVALSTYFLTYPGK